MTSTRSINWRKSRTTQFSIKSFLMFFFFRFRYVKANLNNTTTTAVYYAAHIQEHT